MTVRLELTVRYCTSHKMSASHLHRSRRNNVGIHAGGTANLPCSLVRCDLSIADLPQTMHDLLLAGSIAHFDAIRQFHASGTLQSCSCGPWNYRQKSRSVQWSKPIRHVASVASFLHGQVPGEKRQDLRLNPFGNLVGVVAFVSLECVHDSEIRHRLFQLFVQAG